MERPSQIVTMYPPEHPGRAAVAQALANSRARARDLVRRLDPSDPAAPTLDDVIREGSRLQALRAVAPLLGLDPGPAA